ncbi:MAG: hypothetical protein ACRD9S_18990 [Pyrinomonadaceae bacterium]
MRKKALTGYDSFIASQSANVSVVENLAGFLPECQKKGIEGLLDLAPLRAITAAVLSQGYANTHEKDYPIGEIKETCIM